MAGKKAQIGVEFFLVLSVVVAFIVILYGMANQQVSKTRILNDAVLSKNSVDVIAQAIDFVYLSGDGSELSKEVLVSSHSNCFYHDAAENRIYCTVASENLEEVTGGKEKVLSGKLIAPAGNVLLHETCHPQTNTWVKVKISYTTTDGRPTVIASCVNS